jgi:isopentenyl diphosphate isomerase/L-lactate dehydrogenase-like FMN-dependent dehydrogenase
VNDELKESMMATGCMSVEQAKGNARILYKEEEFLFYNAKL